MARNAAVVIENNFVKGLVTEVSELNFPENACSETYDCVFDTTGVVTRRLGFDYEADYVLHNINTNLTDYVFTKFLWKNVAGLGTLSFIVTQTGNVLSFYEVVGSGAISASRKNFDVNLDDFLVAGASSTKTTNAQFASGNGHLFVFHERCTPFYIEYDPDTESITTTEINIEVRDFHRLDDGLDIDERPSTLSAIHKYNLYNQGWYIPVVKIEDDPDGNPLEYWDRKRSDFPSNADVWWLFKNSDQAFDRGQFAKTYTGNTAAPNGHYIVDPFFLDRSTVSGISGLDIETAGTNRPSAGAFFSSRVFYSGVNKGDYTGMVYFSPVIEDPTQYGNCYQNADPTSEEIFDLVPTDGGAIRIIEAASIVKLFPLKTSLLVFASNGIWVISGSQGQGFAANDYSASKISSIPSLSANSFVDVEGLPMWWNADGIYTIQIDKVTNDFTVQSLTDETIKTFINDIPATSFPYVQGDYNSYEKTVQWLFKSTSSATIAGNYEFDRVLVLNLRSQAFYPWRIQDIANGPRVAGVLTIQGVGTTREESQVIDQSGDNVVDINTFNVVVDTVLSSPIRARYLYLTTILDNGNYHLTFSETIDDTYVDWVTFDDTGESYESYFITGYKVHGKAIQKFQNNYIVVFSRVEDDSSVYIQNLWAYTINQNSGRFSVPQQAYPTALVNADEFSVVSRRLRMRGQGLVLQLKFYSSPNNPFNVVGWSGFETGNTMP